MVIMSSKLQKVIKVTLKNVSVIVGLNFNTLHIFSVDPPVQKAATAIAPKPFAQSPALHRKSHHTIGILWLDSHHLKSHTLKREFKAFGELTDLPSLEVGNDVVVVHVVKVVFKRILRHKILVMDGHGSLLGCCS